MARLISTLVVIGLLGATAAAFAVTEGLKLERSPITGTRISTAFSPDCHCVTSFARITFKLRKADSVTATVLGPDGQVIQTLATGLHAGPGELRLIWDGRDAAGDVVPEGVYHVRVHLAHRHQTITLPNKIAVDMTAPRITVTRLSPPVFSPDRDHRKDRVAIHFTVSEQARALLLVNGKKVLRGRLVPRSGVLYWAGRSHSHTMRQGRYVLTLRAQDVAGNRSAPSRPHAVVLRFVTLAHRIIRVGPRTRFNPHISSDARRVRWRFAGQSGFARPKSLRLRAPTKPGRYHLVVTERGRRAAALVIVRRG